MTTRIGMTNNMQASKESRVCLMALVVFMAVYEAATKTNVYTNVTETTNKLLDGKVYDRRLRPHYQGPTLNVSVLMVIVSFGKVREVDMDFTVDMFLVQYWNDQRLQHSLDATINLTGEFTKAVWIPDTFFLNIKEAKFHVVPTHNSRVAIKPDGDVLYSARFTLTASCDMDLRSYPLDEQSCELILLSYSYPTSEVDYVWKKVEVMDETMTEFELKGTEKRKNVYHYSTGDWTQIYVTFHFKRRFGYVFIQGYAPTVLIVVLSWLSFWVSKEAVPARIALGITTVLTIVTLMGSFRAAVPKVSYVKALDMYFIVSFLFVFGAMLEYVAVMMHSDIQKKRQEQLTFEPNQIVPDEFRDKSVIEQLTDTESTTRERQDHEAIEMRQRKPSRSSQSSCKKLKEITTVAFVKNEVDIIDKISRVFYPLSFIIFNIVYWSYYLSTQRN